jgi:hypothetical protein
MTYYLISNNVFTLLVTFPEDTIKHWYGKRKYTHITSLERLEMMTIKTFVIVMC